MTLPTPEIESRKLEQWASRTLKDQPLYKAPRSLEDRVMAALATSAAAPWWRQPVASWPGLARAALLAASVACLWLTLAVWKASFGLASGAESATHLATMLPGYASVRVLVDTVSALKAVLATVAASVPVFWFYSGLALVAGLYLALFSLGAFGYRTFRRLA